MEFGSRPHPLDPELLKEEEEKKKKKKQKKENEKEGVAPLTKTRDRTWQVGNQETTPERDQETFSKMRNEFQSEIHGR